MWADDELLWAEKPSVQHSNVDVNLKHNATSLNTGADQVYLCIAIVALATVASIASVGYSR